MSRIVGRLGVVTVGKPLLFAFERLVVPRLKFYLLTRSFTLLIFF